MQHDEVIWGIIRHNHCSFMSKIETGNFCGNRYNVTGVCNRSSCPLANSRYATILEHDGDLYLYMKTIERAHMPNKLWERVKLSRNSPKAIEQIDKHLMYWPNIHKAKQRFKRMTNTSSRTKKLALKTREKVVTLPRKEIKREARREKKAEKAAVLDKNIEKELLERIKKGVYPTEIYNINPKEFIDILEKEEVPEEEVEEEAEIEYVEGDYELEEEEDMEDFCGASIAMDEAQLERGEEDEESMYTSRRRKGSDDPNAKTKKKSTVLVEVEHEDGEGRRKMVH